MNYNLNCKITINKKITFPNKNLSIFQNLFGSMKKLVDRLYQRSDTLRLCFNLHFEGGLNFKETC